MGIFEKKNLQIWEKFGNLRKIWKFEKYLETCKKCGNFGYLEKNLEIWKKWIFRIKFWNLEKILKFGKNWLKAVISATIYIVLGKTPAFL